MESKIEVLKQTELLGQQFEVYGTPQEPLFKAQDVATMINHSNITKMLALVDDDEKGVNQLLTPGGNQQVWFLTENGLYEVLMQSRKPIAKQFKKGVKAILKEIRTNGGYVATQSDDTPELIMARALQVAQSTIERHHQQLQVANATIELQKKELEEASKSVEYVNDVLQSTSTYTLTQIAKDCNMTSANVLANFLISKRIIFRQSGQYMPTSKYTDKGYFKNRTHSYERSNGEKGTNTILVVTESGRQFIHTLISR